MLYIASRRIVAASAAVYALAHLEAAHALRRRASGHIVRGGQTQAAGKPDLFDALNRGCDAVNERDRKLRGFDAEGCNDAEGSDDGEGCDDDDAWLEEVAAVRLRQDGGVIDSDMSASTVESSSTDAQKKAAAEANAAPESEAVSATLQEDVLGACPWADPCEACPKAYGDLEHELEIEKAVAQELAKSEKRLLAKSEKAARAANVAACAAAKNGVEALLCEKRVRSAACAAAKNEFKKKTAALHEFEALHQDYESVLIANAELRRSQFSASCAVVSVKERLAKSERERGELLERLERLERGESPHARSASTRKRHTRLSMVTRVTRFFARVAPKTPASHIARPAA